MQRVLEECDRVSVGFAADPVHDLRVALRRCRSMADGLMAIDPAPNWKQMKKAGRRLFRALGELRDAQVMTEWVEKLSPPDDQAGKQLAAYAAARENQNKHEAMTALDAFDRKRWNAWSHNLPRRAARLRPGGAVFRHMALERWTEAHELHRQALRNRTHVAFHRLRIGLKRLRYTVENFLPQLHEAWIGDLKELQDLLGEVHDLDVLWATAIKTRAFPDPDALSRWRERVGEERTRRISRYREKMVGKKSLWHAWRSQLPQGEEVKQAAWTRLRMWASFLDPNPRHSQRVTRLCLQLFDGLSQQGLVNKDRNWDLRSILQAAALLHDVGLSKGAGKHHKASARLVKRLKAPLGWSAKELHLAGIVARYHRGALPQSSQKAFGRLTPAQQKVVTHLAAILRLANALDAGHNGAVQRLMVDATGAYITILAQGYSPRGPLAQRSAAARHLLELVYQRPVMVREWREKRRARIS
jgi:exopolyphosphatase/guanosine-5'-triphosphate,3'-diphosphate pyrophosphatase